MNNATKPIIPTVCGRSSLPFRSMAGNASCAVYVPIAGRVLLELDYLLDGTLIILCAIHAINSVTKVSLVRFAERRTGN